MSIVDKVTDEEINKMIDLYKEGKSCHEIGKIINRNESVVRSHLKKRGVYKNNIKYITVEELNNIIIDYNNGMPPYKIGEKYNRNPSTIINKLKSIGVYKNLNYHFSDEDIDFLKIYYPIGDWETINKRFPSNSRQRIASKMSKLGIRAEYHFWNESELEYLKNNYYSKTLAEIEKELNYKFSKDAIQTKALKYFGYSKDDDWTNEENNILIENYSKIDMDEICKMLPNRTKNAIITHAGILGLKSFMTLTVCWNDEDTRFLLNNWEYMSDEELSKCLNRKPHAILDKRRFLGLLRIDKNNTKYSDLNKFLRGKIYDWKVKSMEQCNYQCIFTCSKDFEIHHTTNFGEIIIQTFKENNLEYKEFIEYTNEELDYITKLFLEKHSEYPLGICIRKDIHKLYHNIYGKYNNTMEQWIQFESDMKSGKYNNLICA